MIFLAGKFKFLPKKIDLFKAKINGHTSHISQSFGFGTNSIAVWDNKKWYRSSAGFTKKNLSGDYYSSDERNVTFGDYSIWCCIIWRNRAAAAAAVVRRLFKHTFLKCHYHVDLGNLGNEPKQKTKRHQRTIKKDLPQRLEILFLLQEMVWKVRVEKRVSEGSTAQNNLDYDMAKQAWDHFNLGVWDHNHFLTFPAIRCFACALFNVLA